MINTKGASNHNSFEICTYVKYTVQRPLRLFILSQDTFFDLGNMGAAVSVLLLALITKRILRLEQT